MDSSRSGGAGEGALEIVAAERLVGLLAAAGFASTANIRITERLLPLVSKAFATTPGNASVVVSAFTVGYGLCQLLSGTVGDRLGKLRVITALTLATGFTAAFAALANSLSVLAAARLVDSATAAGLIPLTMAWIGDTDDYARWRVVLARSLTGHELGKLAGQLTGVCLAACSAGARSLCRSALWSCSRAQRLPVVCAVRLEDCQPQSRASRSSSQHFSAGASPAACWSGSPSRARSSPAHSPTPALG